MQEPELFFFLGLICFGGRCCCRSEVHISVILGDSRPDDSAVVMDLEPELGSAGVVCGCLNFDAIVGGGVCTGPSSKIGCDVGAKGQRIVGL